MSDVGPSSALQWMRRPVDGWGHAVRGTSRVFRPETAEQVQEALADVVQLGGEVTLRGAGCSYGDASVNDGGYVLDCTGLDRILSFDPATGTARVEPGVTIRDLWRLAIRHGYWPAVVPGTMAVTIGGAAAMNIHGKNAWRAGTIGEYVEEFTLATPNGALLRCTREENSDVFHGAISGFGMLGCFTELTLHMKKVPSGRLKVWAVPTRDLAANLEYMEGARSAADYLVGWLDLHGKGKGLGRGTMHRADQMAPGEDPQGVRWFDPVMQDVPGTLLGVVPKGWLWPGMWCAAHMGGIPLVNGLKYRAGYREGKKSPYPQSHCAFHFLLDYVPRWHWGFRPGGLIQFQPFVPVDAAERVFRILIERCHQQRMVPYLGVLKRHRMDPFLMTHAVDGFSLAMDFAVSTNRRKRAALWSHCRAMAETVLEAGGRFYYAKDAVLEASSFERIHGGEAVAAFRSLKERFDPAGVLQSDLSRRMLC